MSVERVCGLVFALCFIIGVHGEEDPEFKSVPTTVKTSENDTVLLPCYVENLGVNIVRWWWDGILVADSSDANMTVPDNIKMWPNHTLQVSNLRPEDTGEYTCQVVRQHPWGPIQQVHAIEVLYPPSVSPIPADGVLEVQLGEEVDMRCQTSGVPQPILTWFTKGQEIPLLDNRQRLQFTADTRLLSSTYTCVASNGVGNPASASIRLRILYPPEVTAERSWVHSSPGVRAELACRVTADPDAVVEWLRDGLPLTLSSRVITLVHNDRHSLLIRNVRATDLAHYACKATNMLGHGQQVIQLSGVANPAIFKTESRLSADTNYTLIWEVDSYSPIIEYNLLFRKFQVNAKPDPWLKLVVPADSDDSQGPLHTKSYTLSGLHGTAVYEAMLLSRNRFGWSQPSPIIRFATDGGDLDEDIVTQVLTNVEENQVLSAEVAAILTGRSSVQHVKPMLWIYAVLIVSLTFL